MGSEPQTTIESRPWLRPMVVAVLASVAGYVAARAAVAPTGVAWWDMALASALAIAVTVAGLKAKSWVVIVALAALAPFSPAATIPFVAAVVGLLLAAQLAGTRLTVELAGAGAAAMATIVGLRLSSTAAPLDRFGAPSLLAGTSFLIIGIAALVGCSRVARRRTLQSIGVMSFLLAISIAPIAVLGPKIEADARAGVSAAVDGAEAGQAGDTAEAVVQLRSAERSLAQANRRVTSRWLALTRLLPIARQQIEAGRVLTEQGALMAGAAAHAAEAADPQLLRGEDGGFNLTAVEQATVPLAELDHVLRRAEIQLTSAASGWLLPPVEDRRVVATEQIADAIPSAQTASEATGALPVLLGSESSRRYLVLLATPAETRELGGFVGNYLELIAENGRLSIGEAGRISDLYARGPAVLPNADSYPRRFLANDPEKWPQNWTGMPDFPLVAKAVRGMYPSIGGGELDGVMYVDPIGMAALLEVAGPIAVPEIGRTLDHTTMADYLLFEQYGGFGPDEKQERADLLDQISIRTFEALTAADLSDPRHIVDAMKPVVAGGHLLMTVFDPESDAFLDTLDLRGAFPEPDGTDFLSLVQANTSPNKLDTFLQRSIRYSIDIDGTELNATVEVELHNFATDDLPPYVFGNEGNADGLPFGTNLVHLSIYTSHQLTAATIDGQPTPIESHVELGYNRYLVVVPVGMGETVPVRFGLSGRVDQAGGPYAVTVANQALATTDALEVQVRRGGDTETKRLYLNSDLRLRFFEPED